MPKTKTESGSAHAAAPSQSDLRRPLDHVGGSVTRIPLLDLHAHFPMPTRCFGSGSRRPNSGR
jgi:hypothetical protein